MEHKRTVVIYKRSRFERDQERHSCSAGELSRVYRHWGLAPERIRRSHERQRQARAMLKQMLSGATFLEASQATRPDVEDASLVVALGGDNHFQRVARLLADQLILGINSDPQTSAGALTRFTVADLTWSLAKLFAGHLPVETWTRLHVAVNGTPLADQALCEVFVGERDRCAMSRHVLELGRRREEQKCSGLLAVTGAGSTGWYASAARFLAASNTPFSKTHRGFRFLVTEPHQTPFQRNELLHARLAGDKRLTLVSLNRRHGTICLDAFQHHALPYGAKVEIGLGNPLRVIAPIHASRG